MALHEVAVLGLGAMGSAALWQLARRGVNVIGIDRHDPPHRFGSSHGESRITRQGTGEGLAYVPLVRRAHHLWREIEAESGAEILAEVGCLILARRDGGHEEDGGASFLSRSLASARAFGIAHELLGPGAIRERFAQFAVQDDDSGYFEPGGGYVKPEAAVAAQLGLARKAGARVLTDTEVLRLIPEPGAIRLVSTAGEIRAKQVILSAGAGVAGLLDPARGRHFEPRRQTLHWFEIEPEWQRAWAGSPSYIWAGADGRGFYGFPELGGAGAVKFADEVFEGRTDPAAIAREVPEAESAGKWAAHAKGRLRGVTGRRHAALACLYTTTPDRDFVIDRLPGEARILVVSPCSGHGFKHSAAIGEAAAELARDGKSTLDLSAFGFARLG